MHKFVQSFAEIKEKERPFAGGKGGTLAQLYQDGYPVPDGFVILPDAFAKDRLLPAAWDQVRTQLNRVRNGNGRGPNHAAFAVRSSALSEDSAQASFAGEFETVLDVHTDEAIHDAIHTVHHSRLSERVQAYTEAKGMDAGHQVAVVVQKLVRAELSGILFTADPVSGNRSAMVGNFIYGLGDALVSGEAEPFTFTLQRPKGQYDGPAKLKSYAKKLYKLAVRLEKELDRPQDIEWCVADGKLYLLQSRPITTLIDHDPITQDWNSSHAGDYLWGDNGGIYPDVMTPATWSTWGLLFTQRVGGHPLLGNIGGRLYVNVSFLYAVYRYIVRRSPEEALDAVEMSVGKMPVGMEIPDVNIGLRDFLANANLKMLWRQRQLRRQSEQIVTEMPVKCERLRQTIRQAPDGQTLISFWREQMQPLFHDMYLLQDAANEDYVYPFTKLKGKLAQLIGEVEANTLLSSLIGVANGKEQLASVGILDGLRQVARGQLSREAYMSGYGHRHPNENELAAPRPYEVPGWLDMKLAEVADTAVAVDIEALQAKRTAEFDALWQQFAGQYPRQAKSMHKKLKKIMATIHHRELIRSELTRVVGVARAWFVRAGELAGLGDDVFFLTCDDVLAVLAGDDTAVAHIPTRQSVYEQYRALPPYPGWIRGRFDPVQWANDPNRRQDAYDPTAERRGIEDADGLIRGFPGSAGRVEGIVRRIDNPDEGYQLQPGEILVAVTTNVGWTPLFPRATAVVTDIGAPLAHAAIVARELGIPAVVGCGNATARLKTGDRVRVDGSRGTVEILEKA